MATCVMYGVQSRCSHHLFSYVWTRGSCENCSTERSLELVHRVSEKKHPFILLAI